MNNIMIISGLNAIHVVNFITKNRISKVRVALGFGIYSHTLETTCAELKDSKLCG